MISYLALQMNTYGVISFFVIYEQGKTMVLFLRNWIRSGVNKVRDLCFVDGKLDVDRMYDKIVHKGNIYTEILTVRKSIIALSGVPKTW